jgi:hypothetical protein
MSESKLKQLAEQYGFRLDETDNSVIVGKFLNSKEFLGCDRYVLAANYIRDLK